ncbi:hypothetical protein DFH27DRAFT_478885 [Peziza echinospora]|nr:hypothetical protein DFH27DRAFT_478885 [Peziza echinospora]
MSSQKKPLKSDDGEKSQADLPTVNSHISSPLTDGQPTLESGNADNAGPSTAPAQNESGNSASASASAAAKASRKRTKTGCLTCRKRRIKCGEERPICGNCVKSKRLCEGYNQRVVFKDGMNSLRAVGILGVNQQPIDRRFHPYPIQPAPPGHQALQPIAPAPPPPPPPSSQSHSHSSEHSSHHYSQDHQSHHSHGYPLEHGHSHSHTRQSPVYDNFQEDVYEHYAPNSAVSEFSGPSRATDERTSVMSHTPSSVHIHNAPYKGPTNVSTSYSSGVTSMSSSCPFNPPLDQKYPNNTIQGTLNQSQEEHGGEFGNDDQRRLPWPPNQSTFATQFYPSAETGHYGQTPLHGSSQGQEILDDADDPYDVDEDEVILDYSDEEGQMELRPRLAIGTLLAQYSEPGQGISFRSFLPDAQTLSTYYPSHSSSPLMDPITARVFCHFVYVLGPSISIFERNPPNPSKAFTPGAGSRAPQNVWAYTIPMLSLAHPPLLHAILALSSLHIAKLTKGPNHPSLLHYHIALRRLGKSIADEKKRGHVATLAATLILAYYETMAAEHEKWASHIHGAKQLLREIDFDGLTQGLEAMEHERRLREMYPEPSMRNQRIKLRTARRQGDRAVVHDVDDSLTSMIMGNRAPKRDRGKGKRSCAPSRKELETYQLQSDLFWWYVKMDVYQSFLSGNNVTLDYVHWGRCPPRARIGTLGTPYGSSDHLILLMGRIADFQARDVERKKLMEKLNGGWIPPPSMGGPPRGMMMGRGRGRGGGPPGESPESITIDGDSLESDPAALEAATIRAEQEWDDIYAAVQLFQDSLGPEYKPLGIEYMPVQTTPFGPALYYRTYSIATLQSLYLTSLIILHRCHPDMPAQVMMAAGIAAPKTEKYAIEIARITASLVPTDPNSQINPTLGASLIEASIPLFFAGVQYQDTAQRDWLVMKLREINRLTGWASASRVLLGCLRAWEKRAEMGRGPPYKRPAPQDEAEVPLPGMEDHPETAYYKDVMSRGGKRSEDTMMMMNGDGEEYDDGPREIIGGVDDPRRNFVWTAGVKNRLEYAMGLLGEPEEIVYPVGMLRLEDDEGQRVDDESDFEDGGVL